MNVVKAAVVGGGILGLTLGHRLARAGHAVTILEAGDELGGLAAPADYGEFVWDRFYHCILPQDTSLLALLDELGLRPFLRWRTTETGYFAGGTFHDMSDAGDFLRFPLLSLFDKARLGTFIQYALRVADPYALYGITARDWLVRWCGRRVYDRFWRPLLKAKFGPLHDQVAAVFIWATVTRLFGARRGRANREQLGYVSGGYHRILAAFANTLKANGVRIKLRTPVVGIRTERGEDGRTRGCVTCGGSTADAAPGTGETFDQVFFTGPTRLARRIVSADLLPHVEWMEREYPTANVYLGVVCTVLVLTDPLTPYYVVNIGDESVALTGVVEITNLIDRQQECGGKALVYLPQYAASDDPLLQVADAELFQSIMQQGLRKMFPAFHESAIVRHVVHRARYVQPLPLVRANAARPREVPEVASPFQIINSSLLRCTTLNNNEVVALADEFVRKNSSLIEGCTF